MKRSKAVLFASTCLMSVALSACKTGVRLDSPENVAPTAGYAILKGEVDVFAKAVSKELAAKYANPAGIASLQAKAGDYKKLKMAPAALLWSQNGDLGLGKYGVKYERYEESLYGVTKGEADRRIAVFKVSCERKAYEYTIPGNDCSGPTDSGPDPTWPGHQIDCTPTPDQTGIAIGRTCQITSLAF